MAIFRPFRGILPKPEDASNVASRPYDVLDSEEARSETLGNPYSFLRVVKPEIDLPVGIDPHDPRVYEQGRENLCDMLDRGIFARDEKRAFYIYRLTMDGRSQAGVVGCCSVDEYYDGLIKKHELTRPEKEDDRVSHMDALDANAEPVFFTYRAEREIDELVDAHLAEQSTIAFDAVDGIRHELWRMVEPAQVERLRTLFGKVPALYVADGHHRTAAAARVGRQRREANPAHRGDEEYNFFLAALFPDEQLRILDYNRIVTDLNGLSPGEFLARLSMDFEVAPSPGGTVRPSNPREFGLYLAGRWYRLAGKAPGSPDADLIASLDVTILSELVLGPVLGITDLRRDKRIDFVGGIRGLGELERRVDSGEMVVAFSLRPVTMDQLLAIADAGEIMPPKTTWFEPKLRSGLVVHELK